MNNRYNLNKIAEISAGQGSPQGDGSFGTSGIPFIKAGNLEDLIFTNDEYKSCKLVNQSVAQKYKLKEYPVNTIVFAKSGMSAMKGRVYCLNNASYVVNHLATIVPNQKIVYPRYLKYFFQVFSPTRLIKDRAYPSIRLEDVGNIEVSVPSLKEQSEIIEALDQSDVLRQKRKQTLILLDEYAKSLFYEMFGDPVENPKNLLVIKFGEIIDDIRYGSSNKSTDFFTTGTLPILRIPNIAKGIISYDDLQYQELLPNEKAKILLKKGDILFVRTNGNPDYIGRCAVFNDDNEYIYASYLIRVRLKNNSAFIPEFIRFCFSMDSYKQKIRKESRTTAGNYNINTQGIKNFDLIKPDINQQLKFITLLENIKILKQKMLEQSQELDNQFQALMQKYFSLDVH